MSNINSTEKSVTIYLSISVVKKNFLALCLELFEGLPDTLPFPSVLDSGTFFTDTSVRIIETFVELSPKSITIRT